MLDEVSVTCPFCDQDFDVSSEIFESISDVQKLKEKITEVLVSEFGISEGRI